MCVTCSNLWLPCRDYYRFETEDVSRLCSSSGPNLVPSCSYCLPSSCPEPFPRCPATQPCLSSLTWLEWPLNVWGQNHIPRSTHSCSVVFLSFSRAPWRINPRGRSQHSPVSSPKAESLRLSPDTLRKQLHVLQAQFVQGDAGRGFQDQVSGWEVPPPHYFLTSLATEA